MKQQAKAGIDWSRGQEEKIPSAIEYFWHHRGWNLLTLLAFVQGALGIIIPMFVISRGFFGNVDPRAERSLIVSLLLVYAFLRHPLGRKWDAKVTPVFAIDTFLILLTIATQIYTFWGVYVTATTGVTLQISAYEIAVDDIVGSLIILLVFEGVRRTFGWLLVALPAAFIFYSLSALHFPGVLKAPSATWSSLMTVMYGTFEGLYGISTEALLSMIFLYLIFSAALSSTKLGAFFIAFANSLAGRYAGGPAKASVIASCMFGSVSGSAIANVATTGSFTIPMMKSVGYAPEFAGAVEATASSGGYFVPPVMGAAAFLISAFTGIPYIRVCLYAAVPALLYYLALLLQVHFRAKRLGLSGMPRDEIPSLTRVSVEGLYLLTPLVLITAGLIIGYSVTRVAIWGILSVFLLSAIRKETRIGPSAILTTLEAGTAGAVMISLIVVVTGVLMGALVATGVGFRLSRVVDILAQGNLIVALVLSALVAMVLGTGMPAILVYVICSLFIIPGLIEMGAAVIAAHLFALIYAADAAFTPPVAAAAYTAAAIARTGPMRVGVAATKLGFAGYVVPILFVLHPALLFLGGNILNSVFAIFLAMVGLACIGGGFEGWFLRRATTFERLLLFAAGVCLIAPSLLPGLVGLGLAVLILVIQKIRSGKPK